MSRWIKISGGRTVMAVNQQGDVVGYVCRRPAVAAAHQFIGPLYADSYDIALDLVHALTRDIVGQNISIAAWCVTYSTNCNDKLGRST